MASYSKKSAAKQLGISTKELESKAKSAGFKDTKSYWNFIGGASAPIINQITQQIIDLDRQLDGLPELGLTDAEKENFLQKAIEQVQPYYDRKIAEINAGIKEGSLRTAEDILLYTRDVENEVRATLESLDLRNAKTEEEFTNTLADITAGKDEDLAARREDWRLKMETLKMDQIGRGIFSSGIGKEKRSEFQTSQQREEAAITAQAGRQQTVAETAKKYDIQQIQLAREAAARDRAAKIGAPTETATTEQQALGTLGLTEMNQLPGRAQIEMARGTEARNITTYRPEALTALSEEQLKAQESRKQELQTEELALRQQEYEKQRQKILASKQTAMSSLASYRGY